MINDSKQIDESYVRWGFTCGHFSMVHYIKLVPCSGFFLDEAGQLQQWSGLSWETLNYLEGNHLYRTGYCRLDPTTIGFICLTADWITETEYAEKRLRFDYLSSVSPYVDYRELKTIIEANAR